MYIHFMFKDMCIYMNIYLFIYIYIYMAGFLGLAPVSRRGRFIRDAVRFLVYIYIYTYMYKYVYI